ncbi:hypothetical protein G6F31_018001 [Rhizopus arrhizus]|nr:hypothetical protein G6F31_018001 [Rhizopus arrhizus]
MGKALDCAFAQPRGIGKLRQRHGGLPFAEGPQNGNATRQRSNKQRGILGVSRQGHGTGRAERKRIAYRITRPARCGPPVIARRGSTDRPRIHGAAVAPQRVGAALQAQLAVLADVALEHFAVVAHGLDGVLRPAFAQAEALADARLHTQQAAHLRVGALRLAVGILRRDA